MIGQTILLALAALLGAQYQRRQRSLSNRPLPLLVWDIVAQWSAAKQHQQQQKLQKLQKLQRQQQQLQARKSSQGETDENELSTSALAQPSSSNTTSGDTLATSFATSHSPHFGERPHYFSPPSDMEQYRMRTSTSKSLSSSTGGVSQSKILSGDDRSLSYQHHYIPYPNDAPYTFPAIKARALFTKKPRHVKQVYIASVDTMQRSNSRTATATNARLVQVPPLSQLEDRFRTVYSNAERNQLMITMDATRDHELRKWEREGLLKRVNTTYDFHNVDGLVSPPLSDTRPKAPILEESWVSRY